MSLEIRNLSCGYAGRTVLQGVTACLPAGRLVFLTGANGAGKTTLLRTLLGLIAPQAGEVYLDGRALKALDARNRARILAYLPQQTAAAGGLAAEEVVLLGRYPHRAPWQSFSAADRRRAAAALEEVGVGHLAGRTFAQLSGGEQRLVLAARALAQEARVWLLDEPAAGLDYGHQVAFWELCRRKARAGTAILASMHPPEHALAVPDRVWILEEGRITADGAPDAILSRPRIAALYGVNTTPLHHQGRAVSILPDAWLSPDPAGREAGPDLVRNDP